jgi:DNA-binding PadR family transcriptional regulator
MLRNGLIAEDTTELEAGLTGRRAKIVYKLTAEGKERFAELVGDAVLTAVPVGAVVAGSGDDL